MDHQLKVNPFAERVNNLHFHCFQWELFRLPELECFQAMLNRLYRQELEDLVLGYEAYRAGLQREIDEREKILSKSSIEADLITNV